MEDILMQQDQAERVAKTREFIMDGLCPSIQGDIEEMTQCRIENWYFDWNLENQSGAIWAVFEEASETFSWPGHLNQRMFERKITNLSIRGKKEPGPTTAYWLGPQTILVDRTDVFVDIEQELIDLGYVDVLKAAKRLTERRLFQEEHMEPILQRQIKDVFLDWDFKWGKGYMVLILESEKKRF